MTVFRGRALPERAVLAGYAALVEAYGLNVVLPRRLAGVAQRHHPLSTPEWLLVSPRLAPEPSLGGQLEFALKREGVDLAVLSALFDEVPARELADLVRKTPSGQYSRRVWFLYEWLTGRTLDLPDAGKVKAFEAVDPELQVALAKGQTSSRHRIIDNLPGTRAFCPMARWTQTLRQASASRLDQRARALLGKTHPDIVARAAAFLLLSDSQASFNIEGEQPAQQRALRWAHAIGEAGARPLSRAELERLQELVIGDARFLHLGLRREGGFIGDHHRVTQSPLPQHISARAEDLPSLVDGLVAYHERTTAAGVDAVIAAAATSFGFVYVHPFEDGNGRIHRWLVHHVLARAGYSQPGLVFPVSAAMLRRIDAYRTVLESYSKPLLPLIEWRETNAHNLEVLNETARFYRYFDATEHAEFLYGCVEETVERDLPDEVQYLERFDRFSTGVSNIVEMPRKTVDLLHRFLREGSGRLSKRARTKELAALRDEEVARVEQLYAEVWPPLQGE